MNAFRVAELASSGPITSRFFIVLPLMVIATLLGCSFTPHPPQKVSARAFDFPLEGQLASISVSDVIAIVHAVQPDRVYGLRVIGHNRVEADTTNGWVTVSDWVHGHHVTRRFHSEQSPAYTVVERVHGAWQSGERVFITY